MTGTSFQDVLDGLGSSVAHHLRNMETGPNAYPGVPAEYTNWRDEQWGWQNTCVLFNQSFHMAELLVEGPDALRLLSYLGVNSFANFPVDRAKQFVPCSYDGYVIGDVILFHLAENTFNLVGRVPALNWVRFHAETGDYDVTTSLDERSAARPDPFNRRHYRYQLQGPNAFPLMEKLLGEPAPALKFFHMGHMTIAGRTVRALRHGMAGQPGYEIFGPWADGEAVHAAIVEAGEEFGLRLVGGRGYSSNALESGWIPSPLPAVYTDDRLKGYRQWLPGDCYEAKASVGGSFVSENIEDYYLTPWDLGYGSFVKFDHEFIGREALEDKAQQPHRRKVTLALDNEQFLQVIASQLERGVPGKWVEWPSAVYSMHPYDLVTHEGAPVGISTWIGYTWNERKVLTLAMVDEEHAEPGAHLTYHWGEPDGGTRKLTVEPHRQSEIGATVSPVPYAEVARKVYADGGWRTTA